jgi:hypothetical protein
LPSLAEDFPFPEDEEDLATGKWLAVDEALAPPNLLIDGTRRDLILFREWIGAAQPNQGRKHQPRVV